MKKKKWLTLAMATVLAVSMLGGCAGSGAQGGKGDGDSSGGGNGGSGTPTQPTYDTTEIFRIGNWGVPPHENTGYEEWANNENYCTEENWTKMRDCGFNLAVPVAGPSVSEIERDLDMADKVGMKVLVRDQTSAGFESIINLAHNRGLDYNGTCALLEERSAEIKQHIDTYKTHASFQGVNAYDEPSTEYYDAIAACQDWFLRYYPEYEFYSNLLPVYAEPKQLFGTVGGGYLYPDYVTKFVDTVNPSSLSYDHYPILEDFDGSAFIKDDFMYNLNVFAKEGKKNNVPVYIYLQTMGFYTNLPISTYEEFAWQCYTSMSFGVKGILCFQYWTQLQAEHHNNVRGGIVERDGTITPLYYKVQEVFNEIKAMQDVYLHYSWDGVKTYEGGRVVNDMFTTVTEQLETLACVKSVDTDKDIVVGQFKDAENSYGYMVTNVSDPFNPEDANVKLTLTNDYDYVLICKKGQREFKKVTGHELSLELGAGEGCFVVPVK